MKHLFRLSLLLLALLLPATVLAYNFEVDGIYYNINGNKATVTYQRYVNYSYQSDYSGSVTIPATVTYGGTTYSVTSIGNSAFRGCRGLTSITIPNSVTTIGDYTFQNCSGLTSITIPNSVTTIGHYAFSFCSGLTSITVAGNNPKYDSRDNCNAIIKTATNTLVAGCQNTIIPSTVTSIDSHAFWGCSSLTHIDIPNSVTSIGNSAFDGCSGLTSVTIGNSVTTIDKYAFSDCTGLTSITIPNSVTSISYQAFVDCSGLTSIVVESINPTYDSRNNCNAIIETASNTLLLGCQNTIIPNSVTSIGEWAFSGCTGLTSIDIPNSVTTIGYYAFSFCSGLTNIEIPNSVTTIGTSAFSGCSGLTSIIIPNSVTTIGNDAFYRCATLTSVTIPNSVTSIGTSAFGECSGLTSVSIGNSVTSIGDRTFNGCSSLTELYSLALTPPTVDSYTFNGCYGATLYVPKEAVNTYKTANYWKNFTNIVGFEYVPPVSTFVVDGIYYRVTDANMVSVIANAEVEAYYTGDVIIPASVTFEEDTFAVTGIEDNAFSDCYDLTSITIPNTVESIGNYAFWDCRGLTSITIPNSVTSIGGFAFYCCRSLTGITIPNSVTSISDYTFIGCSSLTSVTIPNSVTSIGNSAFRDCIRLTSVTIPNSVTVIGDMAFGDCSGLTSISIGNSVTSIGYEAFRDCSRLTSIIIPNSVTSIGYAAFWGCSGLNEIYSLALTPPTVDSYTFNGCYGATLYVPKEAVNTYKTANYWKNFTNIVGFEYVPPVSTFVVDGIYYRVTDANMVSVIANAEVEAYYTGDVIIPASVTFEEDTFAVTGIEDNAFNDCYDLTSVVIPNTIDSIGEQAFQGCTGLTSVTIGSGVTAIGSKAFNYCNALTTVKCVGTVPPVMASTDCFSTAAYNRATLIVPRNYEATYAAANYWYKFAHIDGWGTAGMGDVDGDGDVNIKDVTVLIDALLGIVGDSFYYESADLNHNGRIDIGDVTSIVDNLLNGD